MDEKIVCAEIWYNDGKDYYGENPHKPINTNEGIVLLGLRHAHCIATAHAVIVDLIVPLMGRNAQGFLTTKNRFVDRREAFVIAKANNQIIHKM